MKEYKIPTDQLAHYKQSVHYEALTVRGDLSAPNCTTCHGNHGAAPPGLETVQNVCATCHAFQAQLFDASPHKEAFKQAGLPGCIQCHSNHRIVHTSDAMIGTGQQALCADCHSDGDNGFKAAGAISAQLAKLDGAAKEADRLITIAEGSGMEVSEARTDQEQARDALTKARVSVHSLSLARVNEDVDAGLKVAEKSQQGGKSALAERDYRRKGLGLSLAAILIMMIGLGMYIRQIERKQ
jgi:predicted CXXCH cytochrome family protein